MALGQVCLLLAQEECEKVNTLLLLDGSLSCVGLFARLWPFGRSKYENLIEVFGAKLAEIDNDGAIDIYVISLGPSGQETQRVGAYNRDQLKHVNLPRSIDYGQQTNWLKGLELPDRVLFYPGIKRYQVVLISDGDISPLHITALQNKGYEMIRQMASGEIIDCKVYFIVDNSRLKALQSVDNLPHTTPDQSDPFKVYGFTTMEEACQAASMVTFEALRPKSVASIPVAQRARILVNGIVATDTKTEGVYGRLFGQVPPGTQKFTLQINDKSIKVVVNS